MDTSSSSLIPSSAMSNPLMSRSKALFMLQCFWFLALSFLSLHFHLSAFITHLFLHVSTFPTRTISILIIVVLNSLSDGSQICASPESGSDALSLQTLFLPFRVAHNSLLKAGYDIKGTVIDRPLVQGFIFMWLGVRFFLLFAVATVSETKISCSILASVYSIVFGFPLTLFKYGQRPAVLFAVIPLLYSSLIDVARCGRRGSVLLSIIRSQSFSETELDILLIQLW